MESFKYVLDKSSKKFKCPSCNKSTFVRYIDNDTGSYLEETFGRCDRESKCNFHISPPKGVKCFPVNFLSIQSISGKAFKATDSNGSITIIPKSQVYEKVNNNCWISEWFLKSNNIFYSEGEKKYFNPENIPVVNVITEVKAIPEEPSYHSIKQVDEMYNANPIKDNLFTYLRSIFTEVEVYAAMQNYFLTGTNLCWKNSTVFWQMDNKERVHAAKIMLYDASTGKRVKEPYNHITWLHKALKTPEFNLKQCLFGLQRLNEDANKNIAIVESEKTAIIMSIIVPDVTWLATGSKQNLKVEFIKPLVGRKIILYPDKGEYNDWFKKAEIIKEFGYKIEVSDFLEKTDHNQGFDLADFYLAENKAQHCL